MNGIRRVAILAVALLAPTFAAAQLAPATGRLLVSTPALADPNFSETVLLLMHHDEDGSLAVFLNRPTWVDAAEAFPEIASLAAYEDRLYLGGPVAPTQLLALIEPVGREPPDSTELSDGIFLTTNLDLLDELGDASVRVYAGHAAWAPGQLESEIAAGDWRVLAGGHDRIFTADPLDLWFELTNAESELTARAP